MALRKPNAFEIARWMNMESAVIELLIAIGRVDHQGVSLALDELTRMVNHGAKARFVGWSEAAQAAQDAPERDNTASDMSECS